MRMALMRFSAGRSSTEWPHDPRLDPYRDSVWELSREGQTVAFLTTEVVRMRSLPRPWVKREWLWYQVHWLDGRRNRPGEDYGPNWYTVAELEEGRLEDAWTEEEFDAVQVQGDDRERYWERYGPPRQNRAP